MPKRRIDTEAMQLIHGDCLEIMKDLPERSVDMILADPPYGTTACKWDTVIPFDPMWEQLKRITKKNRAIVLFGSQPFTSALLMSNPKMFKYEWVWEKPQGVDPFMSKIRPLNNIEYVLVFSEGKALYFPQLEIGKPYKVVRDKTPRVKETNGTIMKQTETINLGTRLPTRIIKCNQQKGLHPTQKPVALIEYLIKTYTLENETVLDFTMGSGSSGVACKNLNRNFIGIELEKKYFDIASARIKNHQTQLRIK